MTNAEGFRITDRRAAARTGSATSTTGIPLSRESQRRLAASANPEVLRALEAGRAGPVPTDLSESRRMFNQRTAGKRLGSLGTGGGAGNSINFATQRSHDPFFHWEQNNLIFDVEKAGEMAAMRRLMRHIYRAHSVMASAIDIYSYWPLTGMEFQSKDKALTEFYSDLFFDQLEYEEYLPSMLHEYWVAGEAFPLGSFNETLGIWEADELINPDDVVVNKTPFAREAEMLIRLPESLRRVLQTRQPVAQYEALMRSYPELASYAHENSLMPVSNVLLKHLKFKGDNFATRGLPIMYRALRPLLQEEALNAAQDAIADRLYTPLVLAKIGASATDLGTTEPWIPTVDQIANFEAGLDAALAADFRIMTTHFAVDMQSVFGRETMPNFDNDFERLVEKELQAFGLSKTMLSGAGSGETYAADALNRDLVSQLLSRAQRLVRRFVTDRMLVVAEAQEHYDYEVRGGVRYPIMEEVLEVDEETGEQRIVEQPKLLVPDLRLKAMNMRDEQTERDFLGALRQEGFPISQKRRLVNVDIDLDAEVEAVAEEQIEQAVEAQRVRKATYLRLVAEGLPIPEDLREDFQPKPLPPAAAAPSDAPTRLPTVGMDGQDTSALAPTPEVLDTPPGQPLGVPAGPGGVLEDDAPLPVRTLPRNRLLGEESNRVPESDEQRAGMPRAAAHLPAPPVLRSADGVALVDEDLQPRLAKAGGLMQGPRHIGLRRYSGVTTDTVLGYEEQPA